MNNQLKLDLVEDRLKDGLSIKKQIVVNHLLMEDAKQTRIIMLVKVHVIIIARNLVLENVSLF